MKVQHPESIVRFGICRWDITPPVGSYHRMWGAAAHDRSEGIHRPLTATVVCFSPLNGESADSSTSMTQVLISLDHCVLGDAELLELRAAAAHAAQLELEAITVTFTHTHAAGLFNRDRASQPGGEFIADYLEGLARQLATAVVAAQESAVEATCTYATGRCTLAAERDFWDVASGQYVCGTNPLGKADDHLVLVAVRDLAGQTLATVVNYACHPTTLAWDNRLISPDYPGAMRDLVEQATRAPCLFLQGASGDLGPVHGFVGDVEVADRNGRQLAYAALSAWESLPPPRTTFDYMGAVASGTAIGTWQHVPASHERQQALSAWCVEHFTLAIPYRCDLPDAQETRLALAAFVEQERIARAAGRLAEAAKARALAERETRHLARLQNRPNGSACPLSMTLWRMGDAIWIAIPGEPYQVLQEQLRSRFPDHPLVVITLSNSATPTYLPPRDRYGKGIYQESIAQLEPGCLEQIIHHLTGRIERLLTSNVCGGTSESKNPSRP